MGVRSFEFDASLTESFVAVGRELERRGEPVALPEPALRALLAPGFAFYGRPGHAHRRFVAFAAGRPVARVVASIHPELRDSDGTPVAAVGLFESLDAAAGAEVLDAATHWLAEAGRARVWGPLNFDIWHGYRFMTRGFEAPALLGEPRNPARYPELFVACGFTPRRRWNSFPLGDAASLAALMAPGAADRARLIAAGYRFEALDAASDEARLAELHAVLSDSFSGFPGYTPLPLAEFRDVLAPALPSLERHCSTLVRDESARPAGFAIVFRDGRQLLLHLGGLTGAERQKRSGLARALFHHSLRRVSETRHAALLATLVAEDSGVRRHCGSAAAERRREYALFERQP